MKNRVIFVIVLVIIILPIPKMNKVTYDENNIVEVLKTIYTTSYD